MAPKGAAASAAPAGLSGADAVAPMTEETLHHLAAACAGLDAVLEAVDGLPASGTPIPPSAQARVKKFFVQQLNTASSVIAAGGRSRALCPRPADIQTLQQLRTVLAQRTPSWTVTSCNTEPLVGAAAQLVVDAASQAARQQLIEKNSSEPSLLLDEAHRAGAIAQAAAALRVVLSIRVLTHQQLVRVLAIAATAMTKSCAVRSPEGGPVYGVCADVAWRHLQPFYTGSSSGSGSSSTSPWSAIDLDCWVVMSNLVQLSSSCLHVTLVNGSTQSVLASNKVMVIPITPESQTPAQLFGKGGQGAAAAFASLLAATMMGQAGSGAAATGGSNSSTGAAAAAASSKRATASSSSGGGKRALPLPRPVKSMEAPLDDCPLLEPFLVGCEPLLRAAAQWPDVSGLAAAVKHYVVAQVNGPALGDNCSSSSCGLPDSATRRTIAQRYVPPEVNSQAMVQQRLWATFGLAWRHLTAPSKPWEAVAQLVAEQLQRVVREQMIEKKSAEYFVAVQAAVAAGEIFAGVAMLQHKVGITLTTQRQLRSAIIITREAVEQHLPPSGTAADYLPQYDAPATAATKTAAYHVYRMLWEVQNSPSGAYNSRDTSEPEQEVTITPSGGMQFLRVPPCGVEAAWQVFHAFGCSTVDSYECEGVPTKLRLDAHRSQIRLGLKESKQPVSEAYMRGIRTQQVPEGMDPAMFSNLVELVANSLGVALSDSSGATSKPAASRKATTCGGGGGGGSSSSSSATTTSGSGSSSAAAAAASASKGATASSRSSSQQPTLPLPRTVKSMDVPLDDCPLLEPYLIGCEPLLQLAGVWKASGPPDAAALGAAVKSYIVTQVNGPALGDNCSVRSSSGLPDSAARRTIGPRFTPPSVGAMVAGSLGTNFSRTWQHLAPEAGWAAVAQIVAEQLQQVVREQKMEKKSAEHWIALQAAVAAGHMLAAVAMLQRKVGIRLTTVQQLRSAMIITKETMQRHTPPTCEGLYPKYDVPGTPVTRTAAYHIYQMLLEVAASPAGVFVSRDTSSPTPTLGSKALKVPPCSYDEAWQVFTGLARNTVDMWECEGVLTKLRLDAHVSSVLLGENESRGPVSEARLRSLRAQLSEQNAMAGMDPATFRTLQALAHGLMEAAADPGSASSIQQVLGAATIAGAGSQQGAGASTAQEEGQDGGTWGTGTALAGLAGLFKKSAKKTQQAPATSSSSAGSSSGAAAADSAMAAAAAATTDSATPAAAATATATADAATPAAAAAGATAAAPYKAAIAAAAGKSATSKNTSKGELLVVGTTTSSSSSSRMTLAATATDPLPKAALEAFFCCSATFETEAPPLSLDRLTPTELQQLKQLKERQWNALHYACAAHRYGLVKQLLDIGMPVNEPEGVFGLLPLHLACMGKIQDAAQFTRLQDCTSFIELLDYTSKAKGGACLDLVMLLLDHGALIAPTKRLPTSSKFAGLTPFHLLAAYSGGGDDTDESDWVLWNPFVSKAIACTGQRCSQGLDSPMSSAYYCVETDALGWAMADLSEAAKGHISLKGGALERLLKQQQLPSDAECPEEFDADDEELMDAVRHLCAAWLLLQQPQGKELVDADGTLWAETALHVAAKYGGAAMADLLLRAGADPEHQRLLDGARALDIAADKGNCIVGWTLLCHGALAEPEWEWSSNKRPRAGIGEPLPNTNCTPDMLVCNAVQCDNHPWNLRFLERLLSEWVPLEDVWPETGETPLLMAIEYQDVEMLRLLVAAGADVNATVQKPSDSTPALAQALYKGPSAKGLEILQILLDAGADFHSWVCPDNDYDLVQTACNMADQDAALKLVEWGAKWMVPAGQRVVGTSCFYPPEILGIQRKLRQSKLSYIEGRFRLAEKVGRQKRQAIAAAFERWVDSSVTPACRDATLRTLHAAGITPGKPSAAREASALGSRQPGWQLEDPAAEARNQRELDAAFAAEEAAAAAASASASSKQKKKKKLTALQKEAQRKEQQRVKMLKQKLQQGGSGSESDSDAGSSREEQAGPSQAQQQPLQEQKQEEEEEPPQPVQQKAPKAKQQQKQDKQQQKKDKQQKQVQRAERQRQQQQGQPLTQPVASPPQPHAQAASAGAAVAPQAAAPSSPPQAAAGSDVGAVAAVPPAAVARVGDSAPSPTPQPAPPAAPAPAGGLPFLPPHLRATMRMSSPGGAAAAGHGAGGSAVAAAVTASQPQPPPAAQQQQQNSVAPAPTRPMPEVPAAMMALLAGSAQQRGMASAQQSSSAAAAQHGARAKAAAGKRPVPQTAASGPNTQTTQQQQVHGQHSKQQQQKQQQQRQAHVPSNGAAAAAGDGAGSKGPKLCVVCSTRRRNVLLIPCSHLVLCDLCADVDGAGISSCPHCGKACKQRIRVHKS